MVAAALLLVGCSRSPETEPSQAANQSDVSSTPEIERYRTALESVAASQQVLALETAKINDGNWSSVARVSLEKANELQATIERLMEFDEAASEAAALRLHVASLQRHLQGIDADSFRSALPDLLLLNESIQSDMDELLDLAAPAPDEMPAHVHDPVGA
ncbi:MAG: hypothetical protein ABL964_05785 [Steroidobacteraceae bacterium]